MKQVCFTCHIVEHAANLSDYNPVSTRFELDKKNVLNDATDLTYIVTNVKYSWSQQDISHYNMAMYICSYFGKLYNAVETTKKVYRACKCCAIKVNSIILSI